MHFYEKIGKGSAVHRAKRNQRRLEIYAIDDGPPAILRFQRIAGEAIAHEGEGYTILSRQLSSQYPGDLYRRLVLVMDNE
jgi:hypothetical protein